MFVDYATSQPPVLRYGPEVDPVGYIKTVWADFVNLFPSILNQQHRAATYAATLPAGSVAQQAARAAVDALARLAKIHTATVRKVEEYGGYIGLSGVLPVAIAAAFSALALIVVWSFREYEAQKQILDMIEAGTLTPEQATAVAEATGPSPSLDIIGGLAGVGGVGVLLLVALAVVLFARRWRPNPDLMVFRENPGEVWSGRVYDLRYRHDEDGGDYIHDFRPGVHMEGLEDGSVRLFHPSRPLWRDF